MNVTIDFKEWGRQRTVVLSEREAQRLSRHAYAIRCEHRGENRYKIGPVAGFVGSLQLSSSTTINVAPRLPLNSFAALLSLAYDDQIIPTRSDRTGAAVGNLTSWCVGQTVAEAQRLMSRGIRRDYIAVEEQRLAPRGRLLFSGSSPRYDGALKCVADEFLLDTPINRYCKAGLAHLAALSVALPWKGALRDLISELSQVSSVPWQESDSAAVERPIYRDYRSLISLLRLVAASRGSEFAAGPMDISAFFFRLHELFERAIYRSLRRAADAASIVYQPVLRNAATFVSGSPNLGITFKPDVGITAPSVALQSATGKWRLVVDAKYRDPVQVARFGRAFRHDNIYQILAYSRVFGCPGVLVYPRVDQDVDISYRVGDSAIRIRTIDLASPDLNAEMSEFARSTLQEAFQKI